MSPRFRTTALAGAVALLVVPFAAQATNGYFAHGYSTKTRAMGGSGVALPQDAMAPSLNPAGLVWVGNRVDAGITLFSPQREFEVDGFPSGFPGTFPLEPGTWESDSDLFVIPHFAISKQLDDRSAIGVSVYGNGGMNTDYDPHDNPVRNQGGMCPSGTFCSGNTGVNMAQLFITPTYSYKLNDSSSVGVSAIVAVQAFEATGLGAFAPFSSSPGNVSNNDHDFSYGAGLRLGWQGEVSPGLTLGLSATSKIYMTEWDDYKGLFAEEGDFDIPANIIAGLAYKPTNHSVVTFDVQHIFYSDVDSIGNPIMPALGICQQTGSRCLGTSNGPGFGWDDMTIFKLGYQWQSSPDWTWRVGVSHGDQPVSDSEVLFNVLAPAVVETHITGGFTKKFGKNNELDVSFMYAPEETVKGVNPLEAPGQQEIELRMKQFEVSASWSWAFN